MSSERYRSECKACTIKITSKYQKDNESWKKRYSDPEQKKAASRAYYAKHKERFKRYRETFKKRHPEYHKEYSRNATRDNMRNTISS